MQQNQQNQTEAEKFRRAHGHSRTMHRLMGKYECSSAQEYRKLRKENRKKFAQPVAPGTQKTKPTKNFNTTKALPSKKKK